MLNSVFGLKPRCSQRLAAACLPRCRSVLGRCGPLVLAAGLGPAATGAQGQL